MKKKIFKLLSEFVSEVEHESKDYELSLFATADGFIEEDDITFFSPKDEEIKNFLRDVTSINAKFSRIDDKTPLLTLRVEEREDLESGEKLTVSSIIKIDDHPKAAPPMFPSFENFLANIVPVTRESDWWTTLNEFINAVRYAIKMKNETKEIASRNIA